ncbi:MAG: dipeptidase PepV [Clostridia bacterium]|nr:dipeptidase PepV [Clostridiales bacterium]
MQLDQRVEGYREDIVRSTQEIVGFKSLKAEPEEGMPFGKALNDTLLYFLGLAESMDFKTKNVDGYAGHVEYGEGEDIIAVLVHLDVVPEGDGWTYPPYSGHIADNKIYGRGTIDNKGPAISALYALKAIKDSGVKLGKRIRIIAGLDEESGWACMDHYFKKEEKPVAGFSPDADFPIINSEMGILILSMEKDFEPYDGGGITVESIRGGNRPNMVPDFCEAVLISSDAKSLEEAAGKLAAFAGQTDYKMTSEMDNGKLSIKSYGVSAHGSTPEKGQNAIAQMLEFLNGISLEGEGVREYIGVLAQKIGFETDGKSMGVDLEDEISGKLVFNLGQIDLEQNHGKVVINIRYPIKYQGDFVLAGLKKALEGTGIVIPDDVYDQAPLYVPEDHFMIKQLKKVYEEVTGEEAKLISIGGGTYARAIDNAVAFGPLLPGRPELAHEKDECIDIDDLITITRIYARAMYSLAL